LFKDGGETLRSEIHNLKMPQQWKESITVPIHKNGDKTDCNNCVVWVSNFASHPKVELILK